MKFTILTVLLESIVFIFKISTNRSIMVLLKSIDLLVDAPYLSTLISTKSPKLISLYNI